MKEPYITPCPFWTENLAATHPDDLTQFERVALKIHIASCPTCTAIRAEYEAMGREMSQLRTVEPRPGLPPGLLKLWGKRESKATTAPTFFSFPAEEQGETDSAAPVPQSMPSLIPRSKRHRGVLIQTLAAALIVAVLLGGFLVTFTSHHSKTGGQSPTPAWKLHSSLDPGATENILYATAAISATDIWAVGETSSSGYIDQPIHKLISSHGLSEHWNGKQWEVVSSPDPPLIKSSFHALNTLFGVAAISANDVWAVGESYQYGQIRVITSPTSSQIDDQGQLRGLIEHWNGKQWSIMPLPKTIKSHSFSAVAAISSNDVWAVGDIIAHWDGDKWSIVPILGLGANESFGFSALAVISASDIWVVGSFGSVSIHGQALIAHWDGTNWKPVKSPNASFLSGVAAISSNNIWAVGGYNSDLYSQEAQPLIEHWNGVEWSIVNSPSSAPAYNNFLSAVVAISANDVWAVGQEPRGYPDLGPAFTEHWDGKQWKIVNGANLGLNYNHYLYGAIRIPDTNEVWAVGTYNKAHTLVEVHSWP